MPIDFGNMNPWEVRMYWRSNGHHTHLRVFTGPLGNSAFCGHLTISTFEFAEFKKKMEGVNFIFDKDNGVFQQETGDKVP